MAESNIPTAETLEEAAHASSFELLNVAALLDAVVDALADHGTDQAQANNMLLAQMALEKVSAVHTRLAPHI